MDKQEPDPFILIRDAAMLARCIDSLLMPNDLTNDKVLKANDRALELSAMLMSLSVKIRGEKVHDK